MVPETARTTARASAPGRKPDPAGVPSTAADAGAARGPRPRHVYRRDRQRRPERPSSGGEVTQRRWSCPRPTGTARSPHGSEGAADGVLSELVRGRRGKKEPAIEERDAVSVKPSAVRGETNARIGSSEDSRGDRAVTGHRGAGTGRRGVFLCGLFVRLGARVVSIA